MMTQTNNVTCNNDATNSNNTSKPDPEPPQFNYYSDSTNVMDSKPLFVRIIDLDEQNQDILSYNANLYEGRDDGVSVHLRCPHAVEHTLSTDISTPLYITTTTQIASLYMDENTGTLSYEHYTNLPITNICRMQMNTTEKKQMDSGANKSVTDDKTVLHNYTPIKPIPIFGVEKDWIACHIIGKGDAYLVCTDGSLYLP